MTADFAGPEQPFTLSVPQADIDVLREKLALARLPDELEDAGTDYGAPLSTISRLATHWKDAFDWRAAEARINELPMYTRDIAVDGFGTLNIHYLHQKSKCPNAVPLLFSHGWPGHFLEVRKMLPILTGGGAEHPSFHVVAISLPGFGFSEAPKQRGFAGKQYAEVFNKLMLSLGYNEYVYQGGDWGHILGAYTAGYYGPKHLKAWLSNMPLSKRPTFFSSPLLYLRDRLLPYDKASRDGIAGAEKFSQTGVGYLVQQATCPQTLGYSLADSPIGLLAWICEKLPQATEEDYEWTDDELVEWVSIYWFSRAGPTASLRIYYEMTEENTKDLIHGARYAPVPLGLSYFPRDIFQLPPFWANTLGNVVFVSRHEKGGHFAAHEKPEALAGDIRKMFGKGGPAYGVVSGKNGYA